MGRYKRKKGKKKKQKRIANVKMILDLIHSNQEKFEHMSNDLIQIQRKEIEIGDEWNSESGYEYEISFGDKTSYSVGEVKIIEDREDYAKADSWIENFCVDANMGNNVPAVEVLEKLEKISGKRLK